MYTKQNTKKDMTWLDRHIKNDKQQQRNKIVQGTQLWVDAENSAWDPIH